jgi:ABC superfamily ATP binding cassette transporter, binding protein
MKINKLLTLLLTSTVLLTACNPSTNDTTSQNSTIKKYKIGITQLVEHPALDDARKGFEEELKANNIDAQIIYKNAQGDMATATTIAQSLVDDKVDLIYSISTPSAQASKQSTSDIPIIYSAVTDPEKSELIGDNITGVSDKTPIKEQLELFRKLSGDVKKIGILYSNTETNSQIQVAESKQVAKELGLEIIDIGINNINDMQQAIDALIDKSDGIYVITDNLVAKSLNLLTSKANEAKKILVMGYLDSSENAKNVLISNGVSYVDFGKQAADMATKILKENVKPSTIPVKYAEKTYNTVSMSIVKQLGIDENNEIIKNSTKIQ